MKLLKEYFALQAKIYEHFGYVEDYVVIPLDDHTDEFWYLTPDETHIYHSSKEFTVDMVTAGNELYSGTVYTQRFLPKWVYRTDDYTMICVDTHCDGNKFLMVFDNAKELRNVSSKLQEAFDQWR